MSFLVHIKINTPQQKDRKQQSAQHEKKATEFLQATVKVSAPSIFSSHSANECMKKHLRKKTPFKNVNIRQKNIEILGHFYVCFFTLSNLCLVQLLAIFLAIYLLTMLTLEEV